MSIHKLECHVGVLEAFEDHLVISRYIIPFVKKKPITDKIYYRDITSIEFKNCGWTAGTIEFKNNESLNGKFVFGGNTHKKAKILAEEMDVIHDFIQQKVSESRSDIIDDDSLSEVDELLSNIIEVGELLEDIIDSDDSLDHSYSSAVNYSAADELMKFKNLLDEGIITKKEFNKKKKELLK